MSDMQELELTQAVVSTAVHYVLHHVEAQKLDEYPIPDGPDYGKKLHARLKAWRDLREAVEAYRELNKVPET